MIWNPFLQAAIQEIGARPLVSGQDVAPTRGYQLASKAFVEKYPDKVVAVIDALREAQEWTKTHKEEYAAALEKETGLEAKVWLASLNTEIPDITWIDEDTVKAQQEVADIFYDLKLIPEKLNIKDATWDGSKQGSE